MGLEHYHQKRNFNKTTEPKGIISPQNNYLFSIQKHAASHLHYDFRLELNGVLLSWAIPKGPCFDPSVKRLAIHVEDHPVSYGSFEGIIPKGQYGGGTVMLWDKGIWNPLDKDPTQAYHKGHLRFELLAEKLKGRWDLVRFKDEQHWFLIKHQDEFAQKLKDYDVTVEKPNSVLTSQNLEEIADSKKIKLPANLKVDEVPDFIQPQLATLIEHPPQGPQWLHEVKFDGYRMLAFVNKQKVTLKSRNNKDWTHDLMPVAQALKKLSLNQVIFDGEVVVLNKEGRLDFQLLQNAIKADSKVNFVYYIFDILFYEQHDLRKLPLLNRKEILKTLISKQNTTLAYSDHIINNGEEIFHHSCELGLEGIISKQVDSPYSSNRSKSWVKVKCLKRQEFVIGGYSLSQNKERGIKSLYLGVFDEGKLIYTGNVGTGFSQQTLCEINVLLKNNQIAQSPFFTKIPSSAKVLWVNPTLVAEIEFTEWTGGGHLRHASFKGLRMDKPTQDVKKENETSRKNSSFMITHPEKILYPEDRITKKELLAYYEAVSDTMLPYIINRPLSLVRCPENFEDCFFQRHYNESTPKALKSIPVEGKEGIEQFIYLDSREGLLSLVQMSVLEIHPWGSLISHLDNPDFMVIDLDPAPNVAWHEVVEAAFEIKHHLADFKLKSFVKTTGGKGLHVVVPIKPEYTWDEVKNFTHVFVLFLEKLKPQKYISKMTKAKRDGKIFIDYLRNQKSATAIGAYSTRARPHAPVSVPIHWDELTNNRQDTDFTIRTLPQRLAGLSNDPWKEFWTVNQSLHLDQI